MKIPFVVKKCKKCNKWLVANATNFHKAKDNKYGLRSICKECACRCRKEHYYKNREDRRRINDPNEIVVHKEKGYAEIILYNIKSEEVARTKIDIEDVEKVKDYKWCRDTCGKGYVMTKKDGKVYKLHRFIMDYEGDLYIDHINGDGMDNRKANLRIVTPNQNSWNKAMNSNNTTGVTGVSLDKRHGKWFSHIRVSGKYIYLGYFDTFEKAVEVRLKAEEEYFGEFRRNA